MMDFDHHRKFLLAEVVIGSDKIQDKDYYESCYMCYSGCPKECDQYQPPPHPPTPPTTSNHEMSTILILMLCVLGAFFLFLSYLTIRKYKNSRRRTRNINNNSPPLDDHSFRQDFLDEHQGPVVDHHVWYIRTVGLPQTIIDLIPMFKYKKGLIEGSRDCSVCLSEFEENECLRLLSKCSHSFHVACIDTWLRSHTNCPVCRAPVVVTNANTSLVESIDSETRNDNRFEDELERDDENREMGREGNSSGAIVIDEDKLIDFLSKNGCNLNTRNGGIRGLSDLADQYRSKMDRELHSVRRSVSMDFRSANRVNAGKGEGFSGLEIIEKQSLDKIGKRGSVCRLIKSCSYGHSLHKGSISMKRSFSFSGKRSLRKQSRFQESM